MRIGIDLDNTIINYQHVFYSAARKLNFVPVFQDKSKANVKQFLMESNQEKLWTELQGIVYGREILRAQPYLGCYEAIESLINLKHDIFIISHKTKYPVIGDKVSLRHSALMWLNENKFTSLVSPENILFLGTQSEKVEKIVQLNCQVFIDDLMAIFKHHLFPKATKKILFSPDNISSYYSSNEINVLSKWNNICEFVI